MQVSWSGEPEVGLRPLAPQGENSETVISFLVVGHCT